MKKIYTTLSSALIFLPILLALLYTAGINYYHSYLGFFGIPFGIFNIDLDQTLYFGGIVIGLITINFWLYAAVTTIFIAFLPTLVNWYSLRLKPRKKRTDRKILILTEKQQFFENICLNITFILVIIFSSLIIFAETIYISSIKGKELAEKNTTPGSSLLLFRLNNGKSQEIGYILSANETWVALYTKNKKLIITKTSNIDGITIIKNQT